MADVAGGERTVELPLQSMATHGRSSSLPAMDVADGERTGGAPPRGNGARRVAGQRGRERGSRAMLTAGKSVTRGRCGAGEVVGDSGGGAATKSGSLTAQVSSSASSWGRMARWERRFQGGGTKG